MQGYVRGHEGMAWLAGTVRTERLAGSGRRASEESCQQVMIDTRRHRPWHEMAAVDVCGFCASDEDLSVATSDSRPLLKWYTERRGSPGMACVQLSSLADLPSPAVLVSFEGWFGLSLTCRRRQRADARLQPIGKMRLACVHSTQTVLHRDLPRKS